MNIWPGSVDKPPAVNTGADPIQKVERERP